MSEQGKKSYIETVSHFVIEKFLFGDGDELKEDTSFLEEGVIDSTGILELVMFLEETYGIKIQDEELVPQNMDSLQNIALFLDVKLGAGPATEA
ncbi:acyl carrier protein [Planctomycetota bacterium]